jgi:hypothetical protein
LKCIFIFIGKIYHLLQNSLYSVRDTTFIETFKNQFFEEILKSNKNSLKDIQSQHNPLFHLISIDKQQNRQNKLVKDLIGLGTSLIEITEADILNDTFYHPSRETFTYAILFNESLNSFSICRQTINYLTGQWKKWIVEGVLANDLWTWNGLSVEQKVIVRKIWTLVTQATKEKLEFDAVFDANHRDMQTKLEMKDKIVTCLNAYCQHAIDKDVYYKQVQEWHQRFEREIIQSIQIPKILEDIVPYAEQLNPYANVRSWQVFLNERIPINGKSLYV